MDTRTAIERILLGESLASISEAKRGDVCIRKGLDSEDPRAGADQAREFMRVLCRELGDRHAGNSRVATALERWVERCSDYEAWDSLMSGFEFQSRPRLLERGRKLFPGTLTEHWVS
ncbi:MAG: hypothetical protein KDB80_07315 [Planctomycetes bacterium]|nr:hypothetical protein [Planctomycetota bacterium]